MNKIKKMILNQIKEGSKIVYLIEILEVKMV